MTRDKLIEIFEESCETGDIEICPDPRFICVVGEYLDLDWMLDLINKAIKEDK